MVYIFAWALNATKITGFSKSPTNQFLQKAVKSQEVE